MNEFLIRTTVGKSNEIEGWLAENARNAAYIVYYSVPELAGMFEQLFSAAGLSTVRRQVLIEHDDDAVAFRLRWSDEVEFLD